MINETIPAHRRSKAAFTLVEVMVATVVLALGTVFISESLFISLDAYNYYARYLSVLAWADEKVWEAQDSLTRFGSAATIPTTGKFSEKNKNFTWYLAYTPVEADGSLYRLDFELSWQEGFRKARLQRSTYAIYHEPE